MADANALSPQPIDNIKVENLLTPEPSMTGKLIRVIGQLDESNISINSKIIYDIIAKHPTELYLLFDLTKLEYMNSKAIGYFTDWYGKIMEGKGKIVIANAPPTVMDILQAVGITELVKCYTTVEEAQFQLFKKEPDSQS